MGNNIWGSNFNENSAFFNVNNPNIGFSPNWNEANNSPNFVDIENVNSFPSSDVDIENTTTSFQSFGLNSSIDSSLLENKNNLTNPNFFSANVGLSNSLDNSIIAHNNKLPSTDFDNNNIQLPTFQPLETDVNNKLFDNSTMVGNPDIWSQLNN